MSMQYTWVQWNRHKKIYDLLVVAGVVVYMLAFVVIGKVVLVDRNALSDEILIMRALGTCAYFLMHVILCIGPLARLNPNFAPLLYNRRHLGVITFLVALGHGFLALAYYGGFGDVNPLVGLLVNNGNYTSLTQFPFEVLGFVALLIMFVMAATSHDFWLKNLSPGVWKALHMLVYVAYGLLIAHVALGALQSERSAAYPIIVGAGAVMVIGLHITAGVRERGRVVTAKVENESKSWIDIGAVSEIPDGRAVTVQIADDRRVAVYRYDGKVSAVSNVCAHQHGPLGEGKIVDGCITCPWHGYQYLPGNGQSPPPYTEKIETYEVKVVDGRVRLNVQALAPGTPVKPAPIEQGIHDVAQ